MGPGPGSLWQVMLRLIKRIKRIEQESKIFGGLKVKQIQV